MATTTERTAIERTSSTGRVRTGGAWLAVGSVCLAAGIVLHPLPPAGQAEFLATVAGDPTRWTAAHGATAVGLSGFVVAGLLFLTGGSELVRDWWTASAWGVLVVAALWVTTAAVVETTAIRTAAVDGDVAAFELWSGFGEAYSLAFVFFALAVAVVAADQARGDAGATPAWASWVGGVAALVAVPGMVLGFGAGIALAGVVWLGATVVMTLWTLWFGVGLARASPRGTGERDPDRGEGPGRRETAP